MALNKQVQAYLPSYVPADEYLNIRYDLVTAIMYSFMYVRGDGSITPEVGYSPDNVIAYAHARGVKVILSVQDMSQTDADTMLSSGTARTTAINNIFNEVVARGFDGVDNNLEKATKNATNKSNMTAFQTELANKFWGSNPNYRLSIAIAAYYPETDLLFDVAVLQNYCNFVMIMGYDWYGSWSTTAGPNSPHLLDSGIGNFPTIQHYESLMNKSKLLFGVPYYGREFQTVGIERLSNRSPGGIINDIAYKNLIDTITSSGTRLFDNVWKTPWYSKIKYTMNIGITVFGSSPNFPVDNIIQEWKTFIETYSNIKLNLVINKYTSLPDSDIWFWASGIGNSQPCYLMNPFALSAGTVQKFPTNVQVNIAFYYYNGLTPICLLGGTYDAGLNGKPFVAIPFGEYLAQNDFPPWVYHSAQVMMHELLNSLDYIYNSIGYPNFPSPEVCNTFGFTIANGWQDCYKYYFSLITQQMYQALTNNNAVPEVTYWQTHYDDAESLGGSLGQKYDVVNTEGLGGIGIWEISQGTNRTELWDLIQQKFSSPMICSFTYNQ